VKKKAIRKILVKDKIKTYRDRFAVDIEMFELENDKEIYQYAKLLLGELDRYSFDQERPKKKKISPNGKYIMIFRQMYYVMNDREYKRNVTPVEVRSIDKMIVEIEENGSNSEEYLTWFFDEYMVQNDKLMPPTVQLSCSEYVLEKFFYKFKDRLKNRETKELFLKRESICLDSAQKLFKKNKNNEIITYLKKYNSDEIELDELELFLKKEEKKDDI